MDYVTLANEVARQLEMELAMRRLDVIQGILSKVRENRKKWIALTWCTWVLVPIAGVSTIRASERPNVILIMADDLGYEGLACNGGTSYATPRFDQIATSGMRFTNCYSQPVCTPSRNKIMTGRSNARNYKAFGVLVPSEITFGHIMKEAGYRTCIAGKWQLSGGGEGSDTYKMGTIPERAGFDEVCIWAYSHYLEKRDLEHYQRTCATDASKNTRRYWNPAVLENGKYRPTTIAEYGPDIYTDFILEFIEKNKENEFFVYYPMILTHSPFIPTPHTEGLTNEIKFKNDTRFFGDMIRYSGYCVERIINKLEELGLAENTLVIFTTDNGSGRSIVSRMGDRIVPGGKAIPVDAGCHAPMLAYWKGTIKPSSVCNDLIDFSDFLPTIAEIGNAQVPHDRVIDGRSFLSRLKGQPGNPRQSIVLHYDKDPAFEKPKFRRVRFAFDGTYKLYLDGRMFHVSQDIEEERALEISTLGEDAKAAHLRLVAVLETLPPWKPDNSYFRGGPDAETKKRINALRRLREER